MPTYQYRCKSCSYEFEEIQKFSDDALTVCPNCGKPALVRIIGGAGLVFKGTGFYQTDYKKPGGETKAGTSSATTKKESKPETKSDSKSDSASGSSSDSTSESKKDSKPSDSSASKPGGSSDS